MDTIKNKTLEGERALYGIKNKRIENCIFQNGESPIKECENIEISGCEFGWKYPVWYSKNISIKNTTWLEMGRAGVWYNENVTVKDSMITAPKNIRRCEGLVIINTKFTDAKETLWECKNITLKDVEINGDYFAMNCSDIEADNITINGNYSFDGARNVVVKNSKLLSKDAFWNCENVTVIDSYIEGEYLAWNSKNVKFINCNIESLQGLCYIDNLVLENCSLNNTNLAFEYSDVNAEIKGSIVSVLNPKRGYIKADRIDEFIIEEDLVDKSKTKIECKDIGVIKNNPDWK